jgi:hypothetical protein
MLLKFRLGRPGAEWQRFGFDLQLMTDAGRVSPNS